MPGRKTWQQKIGKRTEEIKKSSNLMLSGRKTKTNHPKKRTLKKKSKTGVIFFGFVSQTRDFVKRHHKKNVFVVLSLIHCYGFLICSRGRFFFSLFCYFFSSCFFRFCHVCVLLKKFKLIQHSLNLPNLKAK